MLFLEGWCKVEEGLSLSYKYARARPERCAGPQLNSLSGSGCTLCCMYACLCGGYECGPSWRLSLASLAEADTHTQREGIRRKSTVTLCFLVPLCVISIWGGLYNGHMWVLTHRPFQWLTEEHSSSPNSPALLMYLALPPIYFPSPGLIPWLHSMSFFSTYSLTQLFLLSALLHGRFWQEWGRWEMTSFTQPVALS